MSDGDIRIGRGAQDVWLRLAMANRHGLIAGATGTTYVLQAADAGSTVRVRVTASNAGGPGTPVESAQTGVVAAVVNLAPDPGFEANPSTTHFTNGTGTFTWATDQALSPTHSLKIVNAGSGLIRWMTNNGSVTATAGTSYTVSGWLRTSAVGGSAVVTLTFWNASNQFIDSADSTTVSGTTASWTQVTRTVTAPAGTAWVRIEYRLTGSGTAWFDDVVLQKN